MNCSDIYFTLQGNGFKHNLDADYACFAVWESGTPFLDKIRSTLSERFEILWETEVEWSEKFFHQNAIRLYQAPLYKEDQKSPHAQKIGTVRFRFIVIRDKEPKYTYIPSVSGKIELSNLNVVEAKYEFRKWIEEDNGSRFGVHSSNNIWEFFFQTSLIAGPEIFGRLLAGKDPEISLLKKDLEGAGGWKDYGQLFSVLNLSCDYLVQRNFETLPDKNEEKDIDFLSIHSQVLASALGMMQFETRPYKGSIRVGDAQISMDIRFVGDNYYDPSWQKDMLARKKLYRGVYVPRRDDLFFSLLYHATVQKEEVKPAYTAKLESLAQTLGFHWFSPKILSDNKQTGKLIAGFLEGNNYCYVPPLDPGVYINPGIIRYLPQNKISGRKTELHLKLRSFLLRVLPKDIIRFIQRMRKR